VPIRSLDPSSLMIKEDKGERQHVISGEVSGVPEVVAVNFPPVELGYSEEFLRGWHCGVTECVLSIMAFSLDPDSVGD